MYRPQNAEPTDLLSRSYSRLTSLQHILTNNLRRGFVGEKYVNEYHAALDQLEQAGFDLLEFRISPSALRRRSTGGNYLTGEVFYGDEPEVEHELLLMKLEAVLTYFSLTTRPEVRRVGFAGPSRD